LNWIKEHDEGRLIESGDGGYFQYYDCVNEEVCHHMPHRPKPLEQEETGLVLVGASTLVPC